jgi:hypothetical protein
MDFSDVVLVSLYSKPESQLEARFRKSPSLKVSARLAFRIQVLRLELKIIICVCELADQHCRLCANCHAYNLTSLNVDS